MKQLEFMTEPEIRTLMNAIAKSIEVTASDQGVEKPHFVLVLFNDPELGQYVSNCRREDVIKAMKETAERLEKSQDVTR